MNESLVFNYLRCWWGAMALIHEGSQPLKWFGGVGEEIYVW